MTFDRIEHTIECICEEISKRTSTTSDWMNRPEADIYREVVAAILGSRVSFEIAVAATEALAERDLLQYSGNCQEYTQRILEVLYTPLVHPDWNRPRRYRFPRTRASAVADTAAEFYSKGGSIRDCLLSCEDPLSARRLLIKKAKGIGPKQASMVLRNIGFTNELAILDSHLMKFLNMRGSEVPPIVTLRGYEGAEKEFLTYSRDVGWPPGILDQAVWVVMRVYSREI